MSRRRKRSKAKLLQINEKLGGWSQDARATKGPLQEAIATRRQAKPHWPFPTNTQPKDLP